MARVTLLSYLVAIAGLAAASAPSGRAGDAAKAWPNGPFVTSGRWIVDAAGKHVTYAGANWPGAVDTMIPEGLQFQSIEAIVSRIKSIGMNTIRLTYATQMIDEIHENGGEDVSIQTAFVRALGSTNGLEVLNRVLANNPGFTAQTTRLQVSLVPRRERAGWPADP